jgi:hypothetical protein
LEEKKQNEKNIGSGYLKIFRIKRIIGLGYFIKKKQNHRIMKEPEWEMRRIGRGDQRVKESEWEMRRTGRGEIDGLKNRSGKCEGPGRWGGGGDQRLFEKKSFFKKPKTSTKHC